MHKGAYEHFQELYLLSLYLKSYKSLIYSILNYSKSHANAPKACLAELNNYQCNFSFIKELQNKP